MPTRIEQSQGLCKRCKEHTLHTRAVPEMNHVLHLLASVFLLGLWLPVWLLMFIAQETKEAPAWLCSRCGQPLGGTPAIDPIAAARITKQKNADSLRTLLIAGLVIVPILAAIFAFSMFAEMSRTSPVTPSATSPAEPASPLPRR